MKFFILTLTVALSLLAQNYNSTYGTSGPKIDMHGGKHNSLGGYSSGGFRSSGMNMSSFLDRNSTKIPNKDAKEK